MTADDARTSVSAQEEAAFGSPNDADCCIACGRVGGAPYCDSVCAHRDKSSLDDE